MKLFEIRAELERLLDGIDERIAACVDPDTGEVIKDVEAEYAAIQDEISALELDRETKRENLACYIKDLRGDAEKIQAQERTLFARRKSIEKKADRLAAYLEADLNGEGFSSSRIKVSFKPSTATEVDADIFLPYAKEYGLTDLVRVKEEPNKTIIGKLLKAGQTFPGAQLVTHNNMTIK